LLNNQIDGSFLMWRTWSYRPFLKPIGLIAAGSLLMATSMFFRYAYGPWGAPISFFGILSYNHSWRSLPTLLPLWPVAFGLLEAVFAAMALFKPMWSQRCYHWICMAMFLGMVAILELLVIWWYGGLANFMRREIILFWASAIGALVVLFITIVVPLTSECRSQVVRLVGCTWTLVGLYPVSESIPLEEVLWVYGLGYWMLLVGSLLIAAGSIRHLIALRSYVHAKYGSMKLREA
jgi:hypothetical protein